MQVKSIIGQEEKSFFSVIDQTWKSNAGLYSVKCLMSQVYLVYLQYLKSHTHEEMCQRMIRDMGMRINESHRKSSLCKIQAECQWPPSSSTDTPK